MAKQGSHLWTLGATRGGAGGPYGGECGWSIGEAHQALCRRIKSLSADISAIVNTRCEHVKQALKNAVLHMLGSRYRVWTHVDKSV